MLERKTKYIVSFMLVVIIIISSTFYLKPTIYCDLTMVNIQHNDICNLICLDNNEKVLINTFQDETEMNYLVTSLNENRIYQIDYLIITNNDCDVTLTIEFIKDYKIKNVIFSDLLLSNYCSQYYEKIKSNIKISSEETYGNFAYKVVSSNVVIIQTENESIFCAKSYVNYMLDYFEDYKSNLNILRINNLYKDYEKLNLFDIILYDNLYFENQSYIDFVKNKIFVLEK